MKTFICPRCKKEKQFNEFYKDSSKKNGIHSCCKDCSKQNYKNNINYYSTYNKIYREENKEYFKDYFIENDRRDYLKNYYKNNKENLLLYKKEYILKFPEKYKAKQKINNKIKNGDIKRQCCIFCNNIGEAHHFDYNRPLDIIWLCHMHHSRLHKNCLSKKELSIYNKNLKNFP